jgi:DNA-binding CsgD family transcriptional regulator
MREEVVPQLTEKLTARQAEVVTALCLGKPNKIIAHELNIRESTVKLHVRNIMKCLGARGRTEIADMASRAADSVGGEARNHSARDPAKLQSTLERPLMYEVWMLQETYSRLRQPQTDSVVVDALIESFCIHARLLLEFFESCGQEQAIEATEFTGGSYIAQYTSAISKTLRGKLNQQIAHLSENRTDLTDEKIGPKDRAILHETLLQELTHFSTKVLPPYRGWLVDVSPPLRELIAFEPVLHSRTE